MRSPIILKKKIDFALKIANLEEFLNSLNDKANTLIGQTTKADLRSTKKIHIARCFYRLNNEKFNHLG